MFFLLNSGTFRTKYYDSFWSGLGASCMVIITQFIMMIRLTFKNENKISYNGAMDRKIVMWVGSNHASLTVRTLISPHTVHGWVADWAWYAW